MPGPGTWPIHSMRVTLYVLCGYRMIDPMHLDGTNSGSFVSSHGSKKTTGHRSQGVDNRFIEFAILSPVTYILLCKAKRQYMLTTKRILPVVFTLDVFFHENFESNEATSMNGYYNIRSRRRKS